ncbi:UvrD-helicase domain-containing protein [Aquibacillus koreensis]|uniref:DNA 3'-5' helicase n=1 Tax=Aquibacillus koreensis TaxID=279446 RepID=A0A9X3WNJ0_9BACI|nr:UvrD-helicase domain-containing protein [Aquibacillus koreensis]MCT2536860.1 UvrD-helicase domain-containing protein [Aquibacillus koreensis]MDC3422008.1 UvrD-helicase domain-containing protein [Aquibacillus koreensis]
MTEYVLEGLNEKQELAVTTTEGYIRVVAGAGSGKTKALTNRYAYIVENLGIDPSNILCVTFTNKASTEMKKRVRSLIGSGCDTGLITTYHGFCVRVLREDIFHLHYPKQFIILDEEDQKTILREIYEELGITIRYNSFNNMLKKIASYKMDPAYVRVVTNPNSKFNTSEEMELEKKIMNMYLLKQKKVFGLDFDDLINFTFILFEDFGQVLDKWQTRLHYIQVDEFQDSSLRQFKLINMLSDTNENLFVVGDPDQTIYEWRGARPEYFVNFDKAHPTCQTIVLDQNYRSTPEILDVGNSLIKKNSLRIEKDMFTHNQKGLKVIHYHGKHEEDEIKWVTEKINQLIEEKQAKKSDIAILYRASFLSRFIEQGLIRENIDYTIYGGMKFFQRKEIKDALAYLRLIISGDDLSFLRVVNTPKRNIGKKRIQFIKEKADRENLTYYDTLKKYAGDSLFNSTKALEFLALIEKYKREYAKLTVSELLQKLLLESGYDQYLREDGDQNRIDNLSEFFHSIVTYEQSIGEELLLDEYLQQITLFTDSDKEDKRDSVKLMTIHTAKGLEFKYVFLCGMTDGILPSSRSLEERKVAALEEERRLTYVAITRAEKEMYITESEGLSRRGSKKYPSRFIFEIKQNLVNRIGMLEEEFYQESVRFVEGSNFMLGTGDIPLKESESTMDIGTKVKHPVFGEGIVKEIDVKKNTYYIQFAGMKTTKPINGAFKGLKRV